MVTNKFLSLLLNCAHARVGAPGALGSPLALNYDNYSDNNDYYLALANQWTLYLLLFPPAYLALTFIRYRD